MKEILISIVVSAIVSSSMTAILARKIAAYHFKVIDSYVKDLIATAKEEINKAYCGGGFEVITGKNQPEKDREKTAKNLNRIRNDAEYRESLKVPVAESVLFTGITQEVLENE